MSDAKSWSGVWSTAAEDTSNIGEVTFLGTCDFFVTLMYRTDPRQKMRIHTRICLLWS